MSSSDPDLNKMDSFWLDLSFMSTKFVIVGPTKAMLANFAGP